MNPTILFENNNLLVINKPAGLVVHGDGKNQEPSVVDWILEQYPEINGVGENMHIEHKGEMIEINRPGIVHRIDRDTSGCLLIARTQESFLYLKNLFQTKNLEKKYHALVYGSLKNESGIIDIPIGRHPKDFRLKVAGTRGRGQTRDAQTLYRVLGDYYDPKSKPQESYTFVECKPLTGRTHQIRVHMKYINHPLVSDPLYKGKRKNALGLERTALHAQSLSFVDPQGESVTVMCPYPQDFVDALGTLSKYESSL